MHLIALELAAACDKRAHDRLDIPKRIQNGGVIREIHTDPIPLAYPRFERKNAIAIQTLESIPVLHAQFPTTGVFSEGGFIGIEVKVALAQD